MSQNGSTEYLVGDAAAVPEGDGVLARAGAAEIGVFRVHGRLYAYENRCAHQGGPVCTGELLGRCVQDLGPGGVVLRERLSEDEIRLICPWHGWEYDVTTGRACFDERVGLRAYEVVERDGRIYVRA